MNNPPRPVTPYPGDFDTSSGLPLSPRRPSDGWVARGGWIGEFSGHSMPLPTAADIFIKTVV